MNADVAATYKGGQHLCYVTLNSVSTKVDRVISVVLK